MSTIEEIFKILQAQTFVALCITIPSYWFNVMLIDVIGRFTIQLISFSSCLSSCLLLPSPMTIGPRRRIVSDLWSCIPSPSSSPTWAPMLPSSSLEIFPSWLTSTYHGMSVASSKVGTIIDAFVFLYDT